MASIFFLLLHLDRLFLISKEASFIHWMMIVTISDASTHGKWSFQLWFPESTYMKISNNATYHEELGMHQYMKQGKLKYTSSHPEILADCYDPYGTNLRTLYHGAMS